MTAVSVKDVLVVGAGVAGTSVALELAKAGAGVVVAERGTVCSGSSGLNAGGVRQQFSQRTSILAARETIRRLETFAEDYGVDPGFRQAGYLFLHGGGRQRETLEAAVARQQESGAATRMVGLEEVQRLLPGVYLEDLEGGAWGPADGYLDPHSMVAGFAAGARRAGATILQEAPVTAIETRAGRAVGAIAGGQALAFDVLVNAAGAWAPAVARLYGGDLPITARRSQIFVLDQTPAPGRTLPLVIDLVTGLYLHSEGEGILSGLAESPEVPDPPASVACDWEELPLLVERLVHRLPHLESASVTHGWAGLIEVTADDNPIVGWTHLDNVYTVAGFSGHGMCLAPGLSPQVASEIRGQEPQLPLDIYRLERFEMGGVEAEGVWGGDGISRGTREVQA
jgi:glycine/D-amino acid oxidase-like deaminating enzyme